MPSPYSPCSYTGDGTTASFSVPFEYLNRSDIIATVNGLITTDFVWTAPSTIRFNVTPPLDAPITISRRTPNLSLITNYGPGDLSTNALNRSFKQLLFANQEQSYEISVTPGLPGTQVAEFEAIYSNRAAAVTAIIPAHPGTVRILGYAAPGDGGAATYKRISTPSPAEDWHFQSADGQWWEIAEPILNLRMLGAKGDGTTIDTVAVQAAFLWASTTKKPVTGDYGTYRITAAVEFGSNTTYVGAGAVFVKDFQVAAPSTFTEALFLNDTYGTSTKTENVTFIDMNAIEITTDSCGALITLSPGLNFKLIRGNFYSKCDKSPQVGAGHGSSAISLACEDVLIDGIRLERDAPWATHDAVHFWNGRRAIIANCYIWTSSDDAIAIALAADDWEIPSPFRYDIFDFTITNCRLYGVNSLKLGMSSSETGKGIPNAVGRMMVSNCIMPNGVELRDERVHAVDTAPQPWRAVKISNCYIGDQILIRTQEGADGPDVLVEDFSIDHCMIEEYPAGGPINVDPDGATIEIKDHETGPKTNALDITPSSIKNLNLSNCNIIGRTAIAAAARLSVNNCNFYKDTASGALAVFEGPIIAIEGSSLEANGASSVLSLENGGSQVTHAAVRNCRLKGASTGISSTDGVTALDHSGTVFDPTVTLGITSTITNRLPVGQATIADDVVYTLTVLQDTGRFRLWTGGVNQSADVYFRATGSPAITVGFAGSDIVTGTGTLTDGAGDGTDAKLNIFINTGVIHIKNRTGATIITKWSLEMATFG